MAGVIHRNIINKIPIVMVPLFKSMVRPHVEYANAVWAPYTKKNSKSVEDIQRHYTKRIQGLKEKSYRAFNYFKAAQSYFQKAEG